MPRTGRPRHSIGTHGVVATKPTANGWVASTRFRDLDGVSRRVTANAASRRAAEEALIARCQQRNVLSDLNVDAPFAALAEAWLTECATRGLANSTIRGYRGVIRTWIGPATSEWRIRDATTGHIEQVIAAHVRSGKSAKQLKVVFTGIMGLAVRRDALTHNPVHGTSRLHRRRQLVTVIESDRATALQEYLARRRLNWRGPGPRPTTDLEDVWAIAFGTGARVGEVLALRWTDLDIDDKTAPSVMITGTVDQVGGVGVIRKPTPKTDTSYRTLLLSEPLAQRLRARRQRARANPDQALFTNRNGGWISVPEIERRWRIARAGSPFTDITFLDARKLVATTIRDAYSEEAASHQLGHADTATTRRHYLAALTVAPDSRDALAILTPVPDEGDLVAVPGEALPRAS